MGTLDGKVALVTGAARGQGRSHAVALAREGADIIALDVCKQIDTVPYAMSAPGDLTETVRLVESFGRRAIGTETDVRDSDAVATALADAVAQLGRLDIVAANAGIVSYGTVADLTDDAWCDMLAVNLTGVFYTVRAAIPFLRRHGDGGSIVMTSSTAGIVGIRNAGHYVAAKHGVIGLMKTLANELGPERIRVNAVLPGSVDTDMIHNSPTYALHRPDLAPNEITTEDVRESFARNNPLPVPWVDAVDISNAIVWLASDAARYVTGVQLPVDMGRAGRA